MDNIENNYDITNNKDNLVETGIMKIGQLKDDRKYDSTKQEEKMQDNFL